MSTFPSSLRPAFILLVLCLLGVATTSSLGTAADADKNQPKASPDRGEQHAARAAEARAEQRRAAQERATPEARAERGRSRSAFKGLGREQALAAARQQHGDVVEAPVAEPLPLRRGERVDKLLSNHHARIELPDGKHTLAATTLPLRVNGEPFSLALRRQGSDLAAENNTTDAKIGGRVNAGVTMASGVRFTPVGATGSEADVVADKAFFANALAAPDVDYILEPIPGGVEALFVLRSADSPEAPALDFDLPEGMRLRSDGAGGAEIVRGDDVVVRIPAPAAWDVDEVEVPARYAIDGSRLEVHVAHVGGDFRYPIIVDPPVVEDSFDCSIGWCQANSFPGWVKKPDSSHISADWWAHGLLTWYPSYTNNPVGGWRDWRFYAVRQSHIYRFDSAHSHRPARSHLTEGISPTDGQWQGVWQPTNGAWSGGPYVQYGLVDNKTVSHCAASGCGAEHGSTGNFAQHGLWVDAGYSTGQPTGQLGGAVVQQWDRNNPTIERVSNTIPSGWVRNTTFQISVRGHDAGLGVARNGLTDNDTFTIDRTKACANFPTSNPEHAGNRWHPCEPMEPDTFDVDTSGFRNGVTRLTAYTDDVILRPRAHTPTDSYVFKKDVERPGVNLSGALWDKRGATVTGPASLTVTATDGTGTGDVALRSGAKKIELWVDGRRIEAEMPGGQSKERTEASCDNCSLTDTFDFDAADLDDGVHTIQVKAWDYAGNQTLDTDHKFDVITDTRSPTVVATNHSVRPTSWYGDTVPAVDVRAEDHGGGMFSLGLEESDGWKSPLTTWSCNDTVAGRCVTRRQPGFAYNQPGQRLTEGINSVTGRGRDPYDNANPTVPPRQGRGLRMGLTTNGASFAVVKTASRVDFNWGQGAPHPNVGVDFSTRFVGKIVPRYSETYTFSAHADDTSRLLVNGQLLFDDQSSDSDPETGQIALQAGQSYDIVYETRDIGGDAWAKLWWQSATQAKEIIPADRLFQPTAGLAAEFFDNKDHTGTSVVRYGAQPNFDAGTNAPDPRLGAETWSVRWLGQVTPRFTDTYTFYTRSDDGTRLWVDGKPLWDNYVTTGAVVERSGTVELKAGTPYDIRLEYHDDTGNASIALDWQSPQQGREVVPIDRLSAPAGKTAPWTAKVDRSPPEVTVSGPLAEIEREYVEGPTEVDFVAKDGATTTPRTQRSGVKSWEIDNETSTIVGGTKATVDDSESWSRTSTIRPSEPAFRDGENRIAIAAMDQLHPEPNHRGLSRRIPVFFDKTPPLLALSGSLKDAENTAIWDGSYDLSARANDGAFEDPRSGVRQVEVFLGRKNADGTVSQETSVHRSRPRPGASANLLPNSSSERLWGTGGAPFRWGFRGDLSRVQDPASVHHGNYAARITTKDPGDTLMISDATRISVQPGDQITMSGYLRASANGRLAHIAPRWWNASDQMWGEPNSQFKPVSTKLSRYTATWTVPSNTTSFGWKVAMRGHAVGDHLDVDGLQIERGTTATEYAPRVTNNLFSNTSFEKAPGTDGLPNLGQFAATWSRVQDAAAVEHGSHAIRLRPNATNDAQLINDAEKVPVTPGEKLNFSAWLRASATGASARVHGRFFDANGAFVGQQGASYSAIGTTRSKHAAAITVPANAVQLGWVITVTGHNGATATPTTIDIDAVQVDRGDDHSEYMPLTTANLFSNTSFERPSGQDGAPALHPYAPAGTWSRVQDAASIHHGRWAARLTANTTGIDHQLINDGEQVPVQWGERITFSGYGRSSAAQGQWTVSPRWRNDAGTFLGQHTTGWKSMTTTRQRFTGSTVVPQGATLMGWVVTMIGHAPGQTLDVDGIQAERADLPSRYRPAKFVDHHHTTGWTWNPSQYAPGEYRVRVRATDHLGQFTDSSFTVEADSPPELKVEGGLRSSPLATGRSLKATATDTYSGIRDIEVFAKKVPDTQVAPDGLSPSATGEPRLHHSPCPATADCKSASGWVTNYELPSDFESGRYQFTVRTTDTGGKRANDQWIVEIVQVGPTGANQNDELGLEHWFDLDDTDAGGDSTVFVNGETGNVVWHQVPIVNPGRGLSSTVNLTYNSHARNGLIGIDATRIPVLGLNPDDDTASGTDLTGLAYNQVGVGFSLAIGGPTRVNEPLGGVVAAGAIERQQAEHDTPWPGGQTQNTRLQASGLPPIELPQDPNAAPPETRITLTDADGTQHRFTRGANDQVWTASDGLNMRLRYLEDARGTGPLPLLSVAALRQDRAWELRRPDGVVFTFDSFGYLRETRDRNNNTLTYDYETFSSLTGEPCSEATLVGKLQADVGVCIPRLSEVQQPTWAENDDPNTPQDERKRKITLDYKDLEQSPGLPSLLNSFGLPAGTLLGASYMLGAGPQVESITDAADVRYDFNYSTSSALEGYLEDFTENASDPDAADRRVTRFKYCEGAPCATLQKPESGDAHQLTAVVPVEGATEQPGTQIEYPARDSSHPFLPPAPRRAAKLVKRGGGKKLFRYLDDDDLHGDRFIVHEHVLGTRYLTRQSELDSEGRPIELVESASDLADENPATAPEEVDDQGKTTTKLAWVDDENKPDWVVEAAGDGAQRTTDYAYLEDGTGALSGRTVTDADETHTTTFSYYEDGREDDFIADLQFLTQPGNRVWEYQSGPDGNVHHTKTPAGRLPETQYGAGGVVTKQQDEMYRETTFRNHDLGGNPQTVILPADDDPSTDPGPRRYEYRYDARGDVKTIVDPRGDGTTEDGDAEETGENHRFVTTLYYDAFGRMVRERIPRRSEGGDAFPFVERRRQFDRDGNAEKVWDERDKLTEIHYDETGQPDVITAPGSRAPNTADDDPEAIKYPSQITRFVYDDAQRMIAMTRPLGASASGAPGFANTVRGEHVAACEGTGAQGAHTYTTRYCLDHKGRPIGEVEYSTRPQDIARRIVSFRYDGRGNLTHLADPNRNTDPETDPSTEPDQTPLTISAALARPAIDARHRFAKTYDALDRPLTQTDRGRAGDDAPTLTRTFHYADDADPEIDRIVDENGDEDRIVQMGHDAMGRLMYRTDYPEGNGVGEFGRTTCFQRQHDGLVTAVATPRAGTTQAQCMANHDFQHSTTEYAYNAVGDVLHRTVPRAAGQYGPAPDEPGEWTIRYVRDKVGNPKKIFDAKSDPLVDPAIENQFYDGGALMSTTRPSFYGVQWPGSANNPSNGRRFGGGDAADVEVARGGPTVTERGLRSANAEKSERRPATPASLGKGDLGDVTPEPLPAWLPQAGLTTFHYDRAMQLTEIEDAAGEGRKISYDNSGRVEAKSWPMVAETQGTQQEEILHRFRYDHNGNLTSVQEDWQPDLTVDTGFEYDGYDRRITEIAEGSKRSPTDSLHSEVTRFRYDANDNVRFRVTPRPTAPNSAERLTFEFKYDSRDNLRLEINPLDEQWEYVYNPFGEPTSEIEPHASGDVESLFTTTLEYDRAGQLAKRTRLVDVPSEPDHDLVWDYDYDADGNVEETTAPGAAEDVVTKVEHDGRGLPWRTTVSDGQSDDDRRVSITEYDANGNLRRLVKPSGIHDSGENKDEPRVTDDGSDGGANLAAISENATVFRYDSSDLLVEERLPWRGSEDKKYFREWKRELPNEGHRQRFLTAINHPREVGGNDPERGTLYDQNAAGWVTRSRDNAPTGESSEPFGPTTTYSYDEQGNQTRWRSLRVHESDEPRDIRRSYYPNGLVSRRSAIKTLNRAGDQDDESTRRHYDYFYNENRSLIQVVDDDANRDAPGDQEHPTLYRRDDAEREQRIDEQWENGKDVELVYEAGSGRLDARKTDGVFDSAGNYVGDKRKTTTFTYDSLGRELTMVVQPQGRASRTTTTRWHDGGQLDKRTKPNGTVDDWNWDVLGRKTQHIRDPQQGDTETHEYDYDTDGNRTLDERGEHEFNARDQLIRWKRPDDVKRVDRREWTTKYVRRADGQVTKKTEHAKPPEGQPLGDPKLTHDYTYDGDRMTKVKTTDVSDPDVDAVTTQTFGYDTGGNMVRVRSKLDLTGNAVAAEPPAGETSLDPEECDLPPETGEVDVTRYCFDEFNRQTLSWGKGVEKPSHITYDGLDRRDSKRIENDPTDVLERRDYAYIGTSELLASESITTTGSSPSQKRLTFDYDSRGERQGLDREKGTAFDYDEYAKDANGSVTALEENDGSTLDDKEYEYDPYGELDRDAPQASTGDELEAGLDEEARDNPFRFEGFYYDSGVKTYDMHARHYRPEVGQFLSRDQFASAAGDMALQADPLTQNRYAFAGGNPVTNVEFDGHKPGCKSAGCNKNFQKTFHDWGVQQAARTPDPQPAAVPGLTQRPQLPPPPKVVRAQKAVARMLGLDDKWATDPTIYDAAGNLAADGTYRPSIWVEQYVPPPSQALDGSVWTDLLIVTEAPALLYGGYRAVRWGGCKLLCKRSPTSVIRGATSRAVVGRTGDEIEDGLSEALKHALKQHADEGLTPRQAAAVGRQPTKEKAERLERLFNGERIDRHVRRFLDEVPADSPLARLEPTPRGKFGPDFRDPTTGRWYDITTPNAWAAHLRKYEAPYGRDGVGIVYNPF